MGIALVTLAVIALAALVFVGVLYIVQRYKQLPIPTHPVPATFRIKRNRSTELGVDELLFQFLDSERDIVRKTAHQVPIGPGVWESRDVNKHVLQLRFEDTDAFLSFLEGQGDVIELGVLRDELYSLPVRNRPRQLR